jgi:hypothetical protein
MVVWSVTSMDFPAAPVIPFSVFEDDLEVDALSREFAHSSRVGTFSNPM